MGFGTKNIALMAVGVLGTAGGVGLMMTESYDSHPELDPLRNKQAAIEASLNPSEARFVKELGREAVGGRDLQAALDQDVDISKMTATSDHLKDLKDAIKSGEEPDGYFLAGLGIFGVGFVVMMKGGIDGSMRHDKLKRQARFTAQNIAQ